MQRAGYEVTASFEETHWWFRSRRVLFLSQVQKARREVAPPEASVRLLDYGCGTGYNLRYLQAFGEVTGADVADESLADFQKSSNIPLLDLRDADLSAHCGRYEIVTALDVLEHIDRDVDGLRRILQFLKPGGQAILTVPAYSWLWGDEDEISLHRRRYTRGSLLETCRAAGARVLFLSYFNLSILPLQAATIWGQRVARALRGQRLTGSGSIPVKSSVSPAPPWVNEFLYRVTVFEDSLVGRQRWRLPAGSSLVCRIQAE